MESDKGRPVPKAKKIKALKAHPPAGAHAVFFP
jgi:hypothetical protein